MDCPTCFTTDALPEPRCWCDECQGLIQYVDTSTGKRVTMNADHRSVRQTMT